MIRNFFDFSNVFLIDELFSRSFPELFAILYLRCLYVGIEVSDHFLSVILGIPNELILLNHRVTEVRWHGIDLYDRCDSTSVSESGNESDDSGKTVIDTNDERSTLATSETLTVPNVTVTGEKGVHIECENGATFQADCAVCTLPLGVLKERIATMFVPPLPDYKIESVNRLLFGTVDKIFLGYERPFLNPDVTEVLLLWENDCDSSKTENGEFKVCFSLHKKSKRIFWNQQMRYYVHNNPKLKISFLVSSCS